MFNTASTSFSTRKRTSLQIRLSGHSNHQCTPGRIPDELARVHAIMYRRGLISEKVASRRTAIFLKGILENFAIASPAPVGLSYILHRHLLDTVSVQACMRATKHRMPLWPCVSTRRSLHMSYSNLCRLPRQLQKYHRFVLHPQRLPRY